ncbi:MAG: carbon storage regulator [Pirellulales bacterium]
MLVLTRKQSEKIRIGDDITITVLKTKGKGVRLGIEAPSHITVLRGELVFELPPEETKQEADSEENAEKPATVRQPVKAHRHQQRPATHWPTAPENQQASPVRLQHAT